MNKCLKVHYQKQRILKRICEKYNLPKYDTRSGKLITYDIRLYNANKYDPYTGKIVQNWKIIKICATFNKYFYSLAYDRHGKKW